MNGVSLGLFQLFLQDNVPLDFPAFFILAAAVGAALYGAWRGLETVARAGSWVVVLLLLGTALVFALACRRFRWENLQPPQENGLSPLAGGAAVFLSRTTLFGEMAVLLPFVRGRRGAGLHPVGRGHQPVCGGAGGPAGRVPGTLRRHPAFPRVRPGLPDGDHLSPAAGRGVHRGVDDGPDHPDGGEPFACRVCAGSLQRGRETLWMAGAAVAMLVLGGAAAQAPAAQSLFLDTGLWLGLTVLTGAGLPLLVLAVKRFKAKGGGVRESPVFRTVPCHRPAAVRPGWLRRQGAAPAAADSSHRHRHGDQGWR